MEGEKINVILIYQKCAIQNEENGAMYNNMKKDKMLKVNDETQTLIL